MPLGVLLSLCAYALYSCCDSIIKALGSGLSVFELAFFTTLFSLVPAFVTTPKGENWLQFWRMHHPRLVLLRGLSGVIGNLCIIYAFVSIPLAEAYSLAFLAPIFIVLLSARLLRETVSWQRWVFLAASFLGVLLVVRPGFREIHPGHLAAIVAALCGAVTTTVLRRVASAEKRVTLLGVASAYILLVNGVLMLPGFQWPNWQELGFLLVIGALGGTANIIFIAATRRSPASHIAPVQYSQIAWAILFGALFFREFPDAIAYVGLAIVCVAGVANVVAGGTRIRIFSRSSPGGAGPATAIESAAPTVAVDAPIAGAAEVAVASK